MKRKFHIERGIILWIYDYLYEYVDEDYAELIKRRLPKEVRSREIKIVDRSVEHNSYINVSFYIDGVQDPPEVFYTHFYFPELEKYWNEVV